MRGRPLASLVACGAWLSAGAARGEGPAPAPALETVVTAPAPPARDPREDQAAAASVVLPDDSPRAYDDLGSLMLEVPGVTVTRSGSLGTYATLTLRGSNPDQVRVYLDGVPLNLAEGGGVDISTLPLGDVERVEVYRGSTPLAFGESALGGIIAITTRTPAAPRATARAGGGSFGTRFGDLTGGGRLGRLRLYAGAHAFATGGAFAYRNDNGTTLDVSDDSTALRANNDVVQVDAVLRAALTLGGRRVLSFGTVAFGRGQGLPGVGITSTMQSRYRTARGIAYARYESRDDLGPGGRLSAQLYASAQQNALHDPFGEIGNPMLTHDTTLSLGASAHAARPLADWIAVAAVIEGRDESFRPVNDTDPTPVGVPARRLLGAVGAEVDLRWRRLDLDVIPSLRLEANRDVVTGRDSLFAQQRPADPAITRALPILRLALVKPLGESVKVKANAGRTARIPSFLELYGDDTGRLLGNVGLVPERGTSADLALLVDRSGRRARLASRTAPFLARVDDLIGWRLDSSGHARADNLSRARILGLEQELRLGLGRFALLTAQATYTDVEDQGPDAAHAGRQLPLHPRWHAYGRPELRRLPLRGVEIGGYVDADFSTGSFADPANLVVASRARWLIGAGLTVDVPRWRVRLTASAQNLTHDQAIDLRYWPLPGRSAFLALAFAAGFEDRDEKPRSD